MKSLRDRLARPSFGAWVSSDPLSCEIMGRAGYDVLVQHCEAHLALVDAARARPGGRRLLPLLVHPATLAAR